ALCHPHNPTGRVFDRDELEALAERVLEHRLFVVSDELHADLNYGSAHVPFASLSPEVARRTVTLVGPTKAFNLAGLKIGFAIAEDPAVMQRFKEAMFGFAMPAPSVSQAGALAAVRDADAWLDDTMAYLKANRDHVDRVVRDRLPGVRMHAPEATYLAWLDFRSTSLADDPAGALLERARLGLNDGASYGEAGRGFARLNFATSRAIVDEALTRIARTLADA
ncbi:MAG: aminotransferase class I/II-fold pyridoxal phosphate-dependent enzyme, partial [Trueperaceae bacterium]